VSPEKNKTALLIMPVFCVACPFVSGIFIVVLADRVSVIISNANLAVTDFERLKS
jgi:hypothetical protein